METALSDGWAYPGARWWKFDFHTHTPASDDYGAGPDQARHRRIAPREWLLNYMRAGIDCVAVTDHNSGDWIEDLQDALDDLREEAPPDYRPLVLFPGVEITANGNIHILALFDPTCQRRHIDGLLAAVELDDRGRGNSDWATNASPIVVVEKAATAGALPILAHVDGPSGAWGLDGNTLRPLLESEQILGVETVDAVAPKPQLYRELKVQWAEVLGSDAHHPVGIHGQRFPGSHFTWVKMSDPTLEGVRLALLDGESFCIRRSDDPDEFNPASLPEHFIDRIEIDNAYYMGRGNAEHVSFSPWLNGLVGGRGTGKSTLIHALRLAFSRMNELDTLSREAEAVRAFHSFAQVAERRADSGALRPETEIRVVVMRDRVRYRLTWRDGAVTVEEEKTGTWCESESQSVSPERFPVRIFSQGQIAALASGDRHALLKIIDEAAGTGAVHRAYQEAVQGYIATRARIRQLSGQLDAQGELTVRLTDVRRKLERFAEAQHADVLEEFQRRTAQQRLVETEIEDADDHARAILSLATSLAARDPDVQARETDDPPDAEVEDVMAPLRQSLSDVQSALTEIGEGLQTKVAQERESVRASAWGQAVKRATQAYETLVEILQAQGVDDPDQYGDLVAAQQQLEEDRARMGVIAEQRDAEENRASNQLAEIAHLRRRISERRRAFLTENVAANPFVRIRLIPFGASAREIESSLRSTLDLVDRGFAGEILSDNGTSGMVADLVEDLPIDQNERVENIAERLRVLKQQISDACHGRGAFGARFNSYLARRYDERAEFLDHVLTWFPEDGLEVEYSREGDGRAFRPIEQASAGQRAAALLAFLLAYGDEPLILDQPEDDLDNHLIYNLVVRQLHKNKLRRQIIVVTHNPNIVVNGDSEMLHALDFRKGQCRVVERGSLQERSMREIVCRVMEGGRDAFKKRWARLGRDIGPATEKL